jgi:hypothetical protein
MAAVKLLFLIFLAQKNYFGQKRLFSLRNAVSCVILRGNHSATLRPVNSLLAPTGFTRKG